MLFGMHVQRANERGGYPVVYGRLNGHRRQQRVDSGSCCAQQGTQQESILLASKRRWHVGQEMLRAGAVGCERLLQAWGGARADGPQRQRQDLPSVHHRRPRTIVRLTLPQASQYPYADPSFCGRLRSMQEAPHKPSQHEPHCKEACRAAGDIVSQTFWCGLHCHLAMPRVAQMQLCVSPPAIGQ